MAGGADAGGEAGELESALDALYAADPDGFVAGRAALASELRRAGRRDDARRVAGLRRPTLVAWAIDHVALTAPDRVDALVAAGERLRRAHEEVVSGGDRSALHGAVEARRVLIAEVAGQALDVLRRRGGADPGGHRDEIEATLEAASTDPDVAALVRRGRLVTAVPRPAGFGGLLDLPLPAAPSPEPSPVAPAGERGARPAGEEAAPDGEEAARAEQVADEADAGAERTREAAEEAAARAERAGEAAEDAAAAVERLEAELAAARQRGAAAREEAEAAREEAEAAREAAEAARAEAEAARADAARARERAEEARGAAGQAREATRRSAP